MRKKVQSRISYCLHVELRYFIGLAQLGNYSFKASDYMISWFNDHFFVELHKSKKDWQTNHGQEI